MFKSQHQLFKYITSFFEWFLRCSRPKKRLISVTIDAGMLTFACWTALVLRLGTTEDLVNSYWPTLILAPLCAIPAMIPLGLYRAVIRYVGYRAIWTIVRGVTLGVVIWAAVIILLNLPIPRSSIIIYWMAALVAIGGTRILGRWMFRQLTPMGRSYKNRHASCALIYGAGGSGQQMTNAFLISPEISPVGFIDDDPTIHGSEISGLRVYSLDEIETLINRYGVDTVLLSTRKMPMQRKREVFSILENYPVAVKIVPSLGEVAQGKIRVTDIVDMDVSDLLGRDAVAPDQALLSSCITQKSVLVTGAGGSIGSELCRQILRQTPKRLVLFELTEFALYSIDNKLRDIVNTHNLKIDLIAMIGNVQDREHLEKVMLHYRIDTVYHAAAYKHVPLVEHNTIIGIQNNVFGTLAAAEAAVSSKVKNFVLVSTDKAVRPTNVMGASKRMAEMVLQAISEREQSHGQPTEFAMVRFGNVLDSSGSVIPNFRKQIKNGGPVTVTHRDITRYFMTIPEAASLVIQAGAMGSEGDVFLLDMGCPVKIVDLARKMIHLSGHTIRDEDTPSGDIEIVYTGLRPGEKLYEELLIGSDAQGTRHSMIMRSSEAFLGWEDLQMELYQLRTHINKADYEMIRIQIGQLVQGYKPEEEIQDNLYISHLLPAKEEIRH